MPAMILAAGRGERLRPITDTTPKALVEVGGSSLIEQQLERLARAGITSVVINLGWLGEQIAQRIGSGEKYGVEVVFSPEYAQILDTGGGIYRALPLLGSAPFWVLNADIHSDIELPDIRLRPQSLAHLVLVPRPAHRQSGDFSLTDGLVGNSGERNLTFSGLAFYRPEFFADAAGGRFSVVPLMRAAADGGQLEGSVYRGVWQDVGTPERLAALTQCSR
ncbi:MAG: nucleotidyltransferase family protein [Woeseiaceae bacterium]|nr:nucleotidyltransferase family protein [Woeseiaceae bacterium]